jgi:hypothetical protein
MMMTLSGIFMEKEIGLPLAPERISQKEKSNIARIYSHSKNKESVI